MLRRPHVLFVPPRYGPGVVGGAERLIRGLATSARDAGCHVEVATTCAVDNETWANALPSGTVDDDGIKVHRFPVSPRDGHRHQHLLGRLLRGEMLSELDAADLMATSIWSAGLQGFVDAHGADVDAIVFAPYLFGTTFWGAQSWPEKTIVVPCLHDEPQAYLPAVQRVLQGVARLAFNSPVEQRLANKALGAVRGAVVGLGFDEPSAPPPPTDLPGRYFVYAGRIEEGKRVHVAAANVAALAAETGENVRLIIIGSGSWRPPDGMRPHVEVRGFVTDDEKRAIMSGAIGLVNPSELESLSIVLMESWLEGRPALVAHGSEVMRDHCVESGGGFTFEDQADFINRARLLLNDPDAAARMGRAGHDYVLRTYGRAEVTRRFLALVDEVTSEHPGS